MKERSSAMPGSDCGKKTCGKTRAAAEPKRKKSYHSMLVPANVESTTRRREEGAVRVIVLTSPPFVHWKVLARYPGRSIVVQYRNGAVRCPFRMRRSWRPL